MGRLIVITFILLLSSSRAFAQDPDVVVERDTLIVTGKDTVLIKTYADRYNPRKALLYAAVLPGLGQVYNKKYWKLPLVYGGLVGLGYGVSWYDGLYRRYKRELFYNLTLNIPENGDPRHPTRFPTRAYRSAVDRAKRERDFFLILLGGMYLLQIIDAHVDAHLKEFDLNPNLQVRIEPLLEQNSLVGRQTGLALVVRF